MGLALRKRFCVSFNFELQAAATDNGVVISLAEQHAFPLDAVFEYLKSASVEKVLTQALLPAPMFEARWRWNATRALSIARMRGGRKVPPQLLRMRANDLLAAVFPDQVACPENLTGPIRIPDHVLVRETIANCLQEAMDLEGLSSILRRIEAGTIRTVAIDTPEPSVFSHEILNANPFAYLDDAPLEERRARAVQLRRSARDDGNGAGILDPKAIEEIADQSWPVVRDADELHDALATLIVLPRHPERSTEGAQPKDALNAWFAELVAQRRAAALHVGANTLWVCAERLELARLAYPAATLEPDMAAVAGMPLPAQPQEAVTEIVRGWLECSGPVTVAELAERLSLDVDRSPPRCCVSKPKVRYYADDSAASTLRNGATGGFSRAFIG